MKPFISIIIPVLDEQTSINKILAHLIELATKKSIEVIIVDADPAGGTLQSIDPQTIQQLSVTTCISEKGRALQMNRGAELASGQTLLFLHADTRLPKGAFEAIAATFDDERIVGGAFDLGIRSPRTAYRVIEAIGSLRSRITRVPYGDQAIFIKKDYFQSIGGYANIPIMEDVDIMRRIKKQGHKIKIFPMKVQTSARRWEEEGILYGTLRNWMLMTLYLVGVSPKKLVTFYK